MKFQSIVVMLASAAKNQAIPPEGWSSIQVNDPHVTDIVNFAVTEFNKRISIYISKLKLVKVINGESQVLVGGFNYNLTISASQRFTHIHNYEAVVLEKPS
ncbi:hypothetical protein TSUD_380100 [Trifolium subterraneum]|uniref:Cystatin domain-containing protein n=1 Tax=Trifolium subterraneum TaxID=3900 RepID=A0A2Z6LZU0_TRISU|nr:hypothetical protein TSUD_380100 [Trifolium subterraneum]